MNATTVARIRVVDEEVVPKGFHENMREDDGSIKVTEKNFEYYRDNDHLVDMYRKGLWGCEEGVTYTTTDAQCPDGRVPKVEALNSISLREDIKLAGRIVCEGGKVFDADTANKLEKMVNYPPNHPEYIAMGVTLNKGLMFHHGNHSTPEKYKISYGASDKTGIPSGEYIRCERTTKKDVDGLMMFTLCDNPECCLMNHAMLGVAVSGKVPGNMRDTMLDYFKNRTMYRMKDEIIGNFDICHRCIDEAFSG